MEGCRVRVKAKGKELQGQAGRVCVIVIKIVVERCKGSGRSMEW